MVRPFWRCQRLAFSAKYRSMGACSREDNRDVAPMRALDMSRPSDGERQASCIGGRFGMRRAPTGLIAWPALRFQHFGAGCRFEFAGVDRHGEHYIVADRAGKLQQLVV